MILKKIYTSPKRLFDEVEFEKGLNIIFAHNPEKNESAKEDDYKFSLHALGKSTLLDLILFALLYEEKSFHRLLNAYNKKILHGLSVVLEFTIDDVDYYIKRSFDTPRSKIYFGKLNQGDPYSSGKLRDKLYALIFERSNYVGFSQSFWYQKLLSYYIKIKKRDELFSDPIDFSRNVSELEQTPFHLFLLDIDNSLPFKHREKLEAIQKEEKFLKDQTEFLKKQSKVKDISKLENQRLYLSNKISKLENTIKSFSLTDEYEELEHKANELTSVIKELWFKNAADNKKLTDLEEFENTAPKEIYADLNYISNIYKEVKFLLAGSIIKTLDEAITFRKEIFKSRKEFIVSEKGRLTSAVYKRNEIIAKYEKQRIELFNKLSSENALNDLTNTYTKLANVQQKLSEINSGLKSIDQTKEEISNLIDQHEEILKGISNYLEAIYPEVLEFRDLLKSIYKKLVLEHHNVELFDVAEITQKQKIKISVLEGSIIDSSGINQIRTLIYDFSVLLNILNKNIKAPRFLIHDGIFENLHKSHFFAFIEFIKEISENNDNFQYILTLNEHDFFKEIENFKDDVILKNSIIKLTPQKTLFGVNY